MYLCGVAHRRFSAPAVSPLSKQRGFCDLGCDLPFDSSCDLPSGQSIANFCDHTSCCDAGSCDWPARKNKKHKKMETDRRIPTKNMANDQK